jgi:energy-coupling factor transporter ATP-binding protein EcfA2
MSKSQLLQQLSAKEYLSCAKDFKKMQEYRIMKVRDRNMQVIYITGPSGSGKSTLAKYMARISNYDAFISGSGKDVLDGYDKEECIILDDLRGDAFTKAELFKLTDNHTNSSVKSRFKNKDISYCKLMIITSIKNPKDLYDWNDVVDKDETFKQFARRLKNMFVYVADNGDVIECTYDLDYDKTTKKLAPFNMPQVYALLGIEKSIGPSLMDEIFKKVKENADEKQKEWDKDLPF